MKFEVSIEGRKSGSNQIAQYRDAFEIDDEARSQERLTAALAAIQRDFVKRPERGETKRPQPPAAERATGIGAQPTPGSGK